MIYDQISNAEKYFCLHPLFEKAFQYLLKNDFLKIPAGKYQIEQDSLFALVNNYFSKSIDESFAESHKKYIDIQLVISGKERMGFGLLDDFTHEQYDAEKDLQKHAGKLNFIDVEKNRFVLFFPNDIHMPGLQVDKPEEIKKVVIKVAI
ncbi:MAG: YhcH/YjgK/YiaL family protein [Bacteroidales bacterium]